MVNQGFDFFAVSTVQEAVEFRKLGFTQQVLMLSSTGIKEEIKTLIENNIIITIGSKETVDAVCTISKEMPEKKIKAHIKIDTGFGRYGFVYDNREEMVETLKNYKKKKILKYKEHLHIFQMRIMTKNIQNNNFKDLLIA